MAYLDKRKKTYKNHITYYYYSRVSDVSFKNKHRVISLQTSNYDDALERHQEVENNERAIKKGKDVVFSWKNKTGKTKVKNKTLRALIDKWLAVKKIETRERTYKRYVDSMNRFVDVLGNTCPAKAIDNHSIEIFKNYYKGKHTDMGININLRGIKALLNWCYENKYIKEMPKIVMFPRIPQKPKPFTEAQLKAIFNLRTLTDFYKDVFKVYLETGMRLGEGIKGEIEGRFLVVDSENSKTKKEREIPLNEEQVKIIEDLHNERDKHLNNGYKIKTFEDKISKRFTEALKELGLYQQNVTNFHCLRHTFAVILYYKDRDIYSVSRALGHSSVKTTEKYATINLERLGQYYPSLKKESKNRGLQTKKIQTNALVSGFSPRWN